MNSYHKEVTSVIDGLDNFFGYVFDNIYIDGPSLNAEEIQKNPLMFVSTHRSHVDYFLFGFELIKKGFKNLRFAAGDNLTKLPYIGPRFTAFGAFTVERDTGFERNYVRNLCNSVIKMMENNDGIIVFPEGGRSYSGATLEIKIGILGAAILTQAKYPDRDVYFLPAALSYEYPPDLPYFKMLLKGKKLRKKSNFILKRILGNILYFGGDILAFVPFVNAKLLKRKYGSVYFDYLEPVSVKKMVDIEANRQQGARDEFSAHRVSMQQLSQIVYDQLKKIYRLLPGHVVATLLKNNNPLIVSAARESVKDVLDFIRAKSYNGKTLFSMDTQEIVEKGIHQLLRYKAISVKHGIISVKKPEIIDYWSKAIDGYGG